MSLAKTLETLVNIPSVTGNEGRICTAIAERLLPIFTMQAVHRIGNSLVVGQQTGRPLIALYGHTDTVPVQGNAGARIEDGRMHGVGTTDMKGGIAVMIHLLEDDEVRAGDYDLVGVFYDKEEGPADQNGLEAVLDKAEWLSDAEMSIVMEPTDLKLELGCNGALNADVSFVGAAAHAARPWLGENAVTKAGRWLAAMDAREPEVVEIHGLEYRETFAVTRANGGIANNVVPARFTVNVNHRFPPIYSVDEAETRLREVAADADEIVITDRANAGTVPEDNPHLDRLESVLAAEIEGKQAWTDVARLTSRGIPAVNYGPGETALAHKPEESIPLSHLEDAFAALRRFFVGEPSAG